MSGKIVLSACLLALIGWWGWSGFNAFRSEREMAVVKLALVKHPATALVHNIQALQLYPYPVETRRQLSGAVLATMSEGRAQVTPEAAEIIWRIGQSVSEWDVGTLVARAAWLLNNGRGGELGWIADRLRKVAPWTVETWIIDCYAGLMTRDRERAVHALERARKLDRMIPYVGAALEEQVRRLR